LLLEPAKGGGSFYNQFYTDCEKDYCEIEEGKDFFNYHKKVDWIITNPPFSIWAQFLEHSTEIADNVVFLCNLGRLLSSAARIQKFQEWGGVKMLIITPPHECGFDFGFGTGAIYWKKGYTGPTYWMDGSLTSNGNFNRKEM
jgi:hypothetical protein